MRFSAIYASVWENIRKQTQTQTRVSSPQKISRICQQT
jgi:hypothetical protein